MTNKQAIIYCRFSPRPRAGECDSNDKQEERARGYCKAYGFEVVSVYRDDAISGKQAENRPGLQAALEHACKIKGVLVVYDISRFARGVIDGARAAERLNKAGAEFVSVTERIDTTTPTGRCFFTIMLAIAQMERERNNERTSKAMLYYQANGRRMSNRVPYGWKVDPFDDSLIIENPQEQRHIELMVGWNRDGAGPTEIARHLEAAGIRPHT